MRARPADRRSRQHRTPVTTSGRVQTADTIVNVITVSVTKTNRTDATVVRTATKLQRNI